MNDLRIEDLQVKENLSVRSFNVLKQNGFLFLSQILNYYNEQGSFTTFRNCGLKSQDELIFLCAKYKNYSFANEKQSLLSSNTVNDEVSQNSFLDAHYLFRLRENTKQILRKNGLNFLKDVLYHYERYRSFKNLISCTQGINNELISFIKNIKSKTLNGEETTLKNHSLDLLNCAQYALLEQWFDKEFQLLPIRARNVIESLIAENVSLKTFYQCVINTDISNIRNAGEKTIGDISRFLESLRNQLKFVTELDIKVDTDFVFFAKALYSSKGITYQNLLRYETQFIYKKIPLFEIFLKQYIFSDNFKAKQLEVLKYFIYKEYQGLRLNEVSDLLNYSAERIRQLKNKLVPEVLTFFEFEPIVAKLIISHTSYVSKIGDCISLNQIRKCYFENEIVNIQDDIIYKAIGILFRHTHSLFFHNNEDSAFAFLISNDIMSLFDFKTFANSVESKLQEKKSDDEFLNLEGYIFPFVYNFTSERFDRIRKVAETIVENGYNLSISFDGNIVFPKNTNKNIPQLLFEMLQRLGKPSHLNEILSEMQNQYPERQFNEGSVRSNILKVPDVICFGRSSTYGLKQWEEEKGIRGGTIREIVEEFLQKFDEPKHILAVEEYVLKFRDTNEKNIITNLKLDTDGRFVIFPGSIIGLSYKDYDLTKVQYKKLPKNAPLMLTRYLNNKKMSESEIEAEAIKVFKVDSYQARYWLRQHKLKGTFSKNLI